MHIVWVASGLEGFLGPLPHNVSAECFAQFLVSKEAIRSRPLAMWVRLDEWLSSGLFCSSARSPDSLQRAVFGPACECMTDKYVAIAFEHLWSFIFSGNPIDHVVEDPCEIYDCSMFMAPKRTWT